MSEREAKGQGRWNVSGRKLVIVLMVWCAILAGSIASYAYVYGPQLKASGEAASAERAVFAVEGMHCTGCAEGITEALKQETGVVSSEVSFEKKEAVVRYVASKTTRQRIRDIISGQGFTAITVESKKQ